MAGNFASVKATFAFGSATLPRKAGWRGRQPELVMYAKRIMNF